MNIITWEMIAAFITVVTFILGIWWRVEAKIKGGEEAATLRALAAQAKADTATEDLQKYKLHVAETYATREGVEREFQNISKSITDFGERMESRLDGMNERLDRVIEASSKTSRSTRSN